MSEQQTAAKQLVYTLMNYWGGELKRSGQRVDAKALEGFREQGRELVAEVERAAAAAALEEFAEKWATADGLEVLLPVSDDVEAVRAMEKALLEGARTYRRNEGENDG